jgi:hypothetical protein
MNDSVDAYDCIGICQPDPVSGQCAGCGRPLTTAVTSPPIIPPRGNDASESHLADMTPAKNKPCR